MGYASGVALEEGQRRGPEKRAREEGQRRGPEKRAREEGQRRGPEKRGCHSEQSTHLFRLRAWTTRNLLLVFVAPTRFANPSTSRQTG
jgi:hypothetical protein